MTTTALATEKFYAKEFLNLRLTQFKKLVLRVKKLVLEIVQYYLGTCYPLNNEAAKIGRDIQIAKTENDEVLMTQAYKDFLNFLPIRFRAGIQGKNLFRQPTDADLESAYFYDNTLESIKAANQEMFAQNEAGMSNHDRLQLFDLLIENEIHLDI